MFQTTHPSAPHSPSPAAARAAATSAPLAALGTAAAVGAHGSSNVSCAAGDTTAGLMPPGGAAGAGNGDDKYLIPPLSTAIGADSRPP